MRIQSKLFIMINPDELRKLRFEDKNLTPAAAYWGVEERVRRDLVKMVLSFNMINNVFTK